MLVPALLLGLSLAMLFVRVSRRWRSEASLLGAFVAMLAAAYYLTGVAIVFFAPAAAMVQRDRQPRRPLWIAYLLLAAALPTTVELARWVPMPASARDWFAYPDVRRDVLCWGLYAFYALGTAMVLLRRPAVPDAAAVSRNTPVRAGLRQRRPGRPSQSDAANGNWRPCC